MPSAILNGTPNTKGRVEEAQSSDRAQKRQATERELLQEFSNLIDQISLQLGSLEVTQIAGSVTTESRQETESESSRDNEQAVEPENSSLTEDEKLVERSPDEESPEEALELSDTALMVAPVTSEPTIPLHQEGEELVAEAPLVEGEIVGQEGVTTLHALQAQALQTPNEQAGAEVQFENVANNPQAGVLAQESVDGAGQTLVATIEVPRNPVDAETSEVPQAVLKANQSQGEIVSDLIPAPTESQGEEILEVFHLAPQPQFDERTPVQKELPKELAQVVQKLAAPQPPVTDKSESVQVVKMFQEVVQERLLANNSTSQVPAPQSPIAVASRRSEMVSALVQAAALKSVSEIASARFGDGVAALNAVASLNSHPASAHNMLTSRTKESRSEAEKEVSRELSKGQELRTLKKVEQALKEVAQSRDGKTISLRLDPPTLGNVKVDVSMREGVLHARISAENPHVNQFLRERGPELQQVLRSLGLEVDRVSVSVRDENTGNTSDFTGNGFDNNAKQFERDQNEQRGLRQEFVSPERVRGEAPVSSLTDHWVA